MRRAFTFLILVLAAKTLAVDVGFQGPPVMSSTNSPYVGGITGTYPTNKSRHVTWWAEGSWWADFFVPDEASQGNGEWHIFQKVENSWVDTSVDVDGRDSSRPNVVYYNNTLWVYSCHPTQSYIYKFTYSSGWSLAAGYPYNAPGAHTPAQQYTDTFTVDSEGVLWLFWIPQGAGDQYVQYGYSTNGGQSWTTGNLATLANQTIANPEQNDKLYCLRFDDGVVNGKCMGVVIGDETNNRMQFVFHVDEDDAVTWQTYETIESQTNAVDDHFDALAYGTDVYLGAKTSFDTNGQAIVVLYKRTPDGSWARTTVWNQQSGWSITRPRIAIDETAGEIYVFGANHISYADDMIVYQKSVLSPTISFSPNSVGTTIISRRDVNIDIDNVCIAKEQLCNSESGIYPVACDASRATGTARYYYWGVALEGQPPSSIKGGVRGRYSNGYRRVYRGRYK